jgi:hypothetical protein
VPDAHQVEGAIEDAATDAMQEALDGEADDPQADSVPSDGDVFGCSVQSTGPIPAGAARSAGFSGTDVDYAGLYSVPCMVVGDCASACLAAGGTPNSCAGGSLCVAGQADGGSTCIPPSYWLNASGALSASGSTANAAELVLIDTSYRDALILDQFNVNIPDGSLVVGIQFDVRRNADDAEATDDSIQIVRNGVPVGPNHAKAGIWPHVLTYQTYGGQTDTWGVAWGAADIRDASFGLSTSAKFTAASGNDRAHIDSVTATVFYTPRCD